MVYYLTITLYHSFLITDSFFVYENSVSNSPTNTIYYRTLFSIKKRVLNETAEKVYKDYCKLYQ